MFFQFDMKYVKANDAFLDILVPVVFTLSFFNASKMLTKFTNKNVNNTLISISKAGLVCIFVHMAIIEVLTKIGIEFNEVNVWLWALVVYVFSWGLYLFFSRFKLLSFLFCGVTKK